MSTSLSFPSFPDLSQADLDKINLTQEAQEFYSDPNELKRLLIERAMYKKAYETQQQKINDTVKIIITNHHIFYRKYDNYDDFLKL